MSKKIKRLLYLGSGIAVLGLLFLLSKYISDNKYRSQIPPLPDMKSMSLPLREQISDAWKIADDSPTARNLGRLGMVFHSSALYDKAAECYKLAVKKNRSRWVWNYYLGYLDKETGDNTGVIENFERVVRKIPKNYLAWYYIAEGYQSTGQNEKAETIYRKIISAGIDITQTGSLTRKDYFSLKSYARFQLANIYLSTGKMDEAEKILKELILNQRTFGQAYRLLGSVYNMKGDQELGKFYVTRAGDLMIYTSPVDTLADILARNSKSGLYIMKQIDDAEKGGYSQFAAQLVKFALVDIPDDKFIISKAIKLYLLMDLGKLAMPYFDKHMELFSSDINEIKMVADLCMKKGLYDQAVKYFSMAARLKPDDMDVHLSIVLCLGNQGAKQQAIDSINVLLKSHKNNLKVLTDGAYVMLMLGEMDRAASMLATLKQQYPKDTKVLQLSGLLLQKEGKEDQALESFEASFKGNPDDLPTTRYLSDLLLSRKMWERAINVYHIALTYNPNDPYLQESLGSILIFCPDEKLRSVTEGREYSERAFINKASQPRTIISAGIGLSEAYALSGDKTNAYNTMNVTLSLAKREKAPSDFIQNLEKKLEEYKN